MSEIMHDKSAYQPISAQASAPLDICEICTDRIDDCPMQMRCTETRRMTLELVKQKLYAGGRRNGKSMRLAMTLNEICDMQCPGALDSLIRRCGGSHGS